MKLASSGSHLIVGVFVRNEWHVTIVGIKWRYRVRANQERQKVLDGFTKTLADFPEADFGTTSRLAGRKSSIDPVSALG